MFSFHLSAFQFRWFSEDMLDGKMMMIVTSILTDSIFESPFLSFGSLVASLLSIIVELVGRMKGHAFIKHMHNLTSDRHSASHSVNIN
jgi:hypothetical protein